MLPSRIYLIGMPGAGKTTLGRSLALKINYHFVDLDQLIQARENMTIADMFACKGEAFFRQKEREALHETFKLSKCVVATGGGTPCFFDNMEQINSYGVSVFIQVPLSVIASRVEQEKQQRPLLATQSAEATLEKLQQLYSQRLSCYNQAKITVSGDHLTADLLYNHLWKAFQLP
ncbi:MAG: shikimate kinase [Cytophagales bacterium]|nr:shikimate kinase [Bernardetiaceae bacterium]MDW8209533.1 shikimate kinase [Cytophagales bacterium]